MSRSIKGKKRPGAELFGKKPFCGVPPNAENKRISRKMDRAKRKADALRQKHIDHLAATPRSEKFREFLDKLSDPAEYEKVFEVFDKGEA